MAQRYSWSHTWYIRYNIIIQEHSSDCRFRYRKDGHMCCSRHRNYGHKRCHIEPKSFTRPTSVWYCFNWRWNRAVWWLNRAPAAVRCRIHLRVPSNRMGICTHLTSMKCVANWRAMNSDRTASTTMWRFTIATCAPTDSVTTWMDV